MTAIPHKQCSGQTPDRRDWLTIERVAELTSTTTSAWRHKAIKLMAAGLAAQMAPPSGNGKPIWWFAPRCDPRLTYLAGQAAEDRKTDLLSGRYPERDARRAARKLYWLRVYWTACDGARRGESKRTVAARVVAQARAVEGEGFKISIRSLSTWERRYDAIDPETSRPAGVDGLVARYGSTGDPSGDTPNGRRRSPEAEEYFYALYHTEQRLTVRMCHAATLRHARQSGWAWSASESATHAWLRAHDDRATTLLMRWGKSRYQHRAMPHLEQDYEAVAPGQMYVCDHHQLKAFVAYRGKAIRPWLTTLLDCRTRVVTGWHLGPGPHSDAILQATRQAFTTWGIPPIVKIDNGKDYTAKLFIGKTKAEIRRFKKAYGSDWKDALRRERDKVACDPAGWFGILPELGCEIRYALPYQPWSKVVERWFRTFTDQHTRTRPAFCDTEAHLKPSHLNDIVADVDSLPTLDQEREAIGEYIDLYHAAPHFGDAMNGRSPVETWSSMPSVAKTTDMDALNLMLNVRGRYKVGANGVRLKIGGTTIGYGQYSAALKSHFGRSVLVAVDPQRIDEAVILTPDRDNRRVIARVTRNNRISPTADATAQDMREAQADINRARRVMHQADASAASRMRTAAEIMERDRRERAAELRATGTHGKPAAHPDQTLKLVQTGIEPASIPARTAVESVDAEPFDPMELVDREERDRLPDVDEVDPFDLVDLQDTKRINKQEIDPMELVGPDGPGDSKDTEVFDPFELVDTGGDGVTGADPDDCEGESCLTNNATRC